VSLTRTDPLRELRVRTTSASGTRAFGAWLAAVARPGDRIALTGSLGAGKTQLAKGFALGLGVTEVVNSPSFTLMAEYEGRLPLFHQDLFRLEGAEDAFAGGLLDERQDQGVTLAEWADRLGDGVDPQRLELHVLSAGDDTRGAAGSTDDAPDAVPDEPREIIVLAGEGYQRYLDRARSWPGEDA
jgi:tRNA threonylcarbamoyladenosine biosynthesis protein TsaE